MGDVLGEGVGVLWMIWMWPKWSFFFRQKSWTSVWRGSDSPCPWGASRCPSSSSLSTSPSPTASSSSVSSPSSTASPSLTFKWFLRWLSATQGCQQWITRSTGVFGFHNLDHYLEFGMSWDVIIWIIIWRLDSLNREIWGNWIKIMFTLYAFILVEKRWLFDILKTAFGPM